MSDQDTVYKEARGAKLSHDGLAALTEISKLFDAYKNGEATAVHCVVRVGLILSRLEHESSKESSTF